MVPNGGMREDEDISLMRKLEIWLIIVRVQVSHRMTYQVNQAEKDNADSLRASFGSAMYIDTLLAKPTNPTNSRSPGLG